MFYICVGTINIYIRLPPILYMPRTGNSDSEAVFLVAMLSVRSVYSLWIVLRKRVGIRPLLIDKLSSIPILQDGAIAPEGFVLLPIVDPFINKRINYQYDDQLPI